MTEPEFAVLLASTPKLVQVRKVLSEMRYLAHTDEHFSKVLSERLDALGGDYWAKLRDSESRAGPRRRSFMRRKPPPRPVAGAEPGCKKRGSLSGNA